jgi:hypothetical protein
MKTKYIDIKDAPLWAQDIATAFDATFTHLEFVKYSKKEQEYGNKDSYIIGIMFYDVPMPKTFTSLDALMLKLKPYTEVMIEAKLYDDGVHIHNAKLNVSRSKQSLQMQETIFDPSTTDMVVAITNLCIKHREFRKLSVAIESDDQEVRDTLARAVTIARTGSKK